jgi:hypothetical protein
VYNVDGSLVIEAYEEIRIVDAERQRGKNKTSSSGVTPPYVPPLCVAWDGESDDDKY